MRDLIKDFVNCEKSIGDYVRTRAEAYYTSDCYTILDKRMKELQSSNDLKPSALRRNEWMSHMVFPIVKERVLLRRAIVSANYRAPEIFAMSPVGSTPFENASNAELVLNLNMSHTFFRQRCLKPSIDTAAKFGSAVVFTYWKQSSKYHLKTVYNPALGTYARKETKDHHENSFNEQIGLRDYFQNPEIASPDESDFQGHYKRMHISDLYGLLEDESYIKENLLKVIADAKRGVSTQNHNRDTDNKQWGLDMLHYEGTINIKGNEEDATLYWVEMVGSTIIKLGVDNYDEDMRSYTVLNFDKRHNFWWGNSDSEYVVAHENYLNTTLGMTLDNAMRSMMQYVFFQKDAIQTSDVNNRFRNNGFIPVDSKNIPLSQLIQAFQPGQLNLSSLEYSVNAVNESLQRMSTKVDLSRQANAGGLNNKTATAANIIAGQSDVLEADILENFDFGVCDIGRKNVILLQQFLSMLFYIRPNPRELEKQLEKFMILGDFQYIVNSTMQKNKQNEMVRLQNLLTWWLNVSENPALAQAGANILPIVKDIFNKSEIPTEEIFPHYNTQQAAFGSQPPMGMPRSVGGPQAAPQGQPMPQTQMAGAMQ